MNTQTMVVVLSLIGLAVLAALAWLASLGYVVAIIGLAMLITAALIALGWLLSMAQHNKAQKAEEKMFRLNAQENLSQADQNMRLVNQIQNVQNKQAAMLQSQLRDALKLPAGEQPQNSVISILDGAFDELEG